MGAALQRRNQVDVTFRNHRRCFGRPQQRPLGLLAVCFKLAGERFRRQNGLALERIHQVFHQTVFVLPADFFLGRFVFQRDLKSRAQHGLGAQHFLEPRQQEFG